MAFFSGASRPASKISLGGRRTLTASPGELLARARREREDRDAARRRTDAAVRVQRVYRAARARERATHARLSGWETAWVGDASAREALWARLRASLPVRPAEAASRGANDATWLRCWRTLTATPATAADATADTTPADATRTAEGQRDPLDGLCAATRIDVARTAALLWRADGDDDAEGAVRLLLRLTRDPDCPVAAAVLGELPLLGVYRVAHRHPALLGSRALWTLFARCLAGRAPRPDLLLREVLTVPRLLERAPPATAAATLDLASLLRELLRQPSLTVGGLPFYKTARTVRDGVASRSPCGPTRDTVPTALVLLSNLLPLGAAAGPLTEPLRVRPPPPTLGPTHAAHRSPWSRAWSSSWRASQLCRCRLPTPTRRGRRRRSHRRQQRRRRLTRWPSRCCTCAATTSPLMLSCRSPSWCTTSWVHAIRHPGIVTPWRHACSPWR